MLALGEIKKRNEKKNAHTETYPTIFIAVFFVIVPNQKHPRCPSPGVRMLQIVVSVYIGVVLSSKKERTTNIYNKTAKSPKLHVEPKKSETKLRNRQ